MGRPTYFGLQNRYINRSQDFVLKKNFYWAVTIYRELYTCLALYLYFYVTKWMPTYNLSPRMYFHPFYSSCF